MNNRYNDLIKVVEDSTKKKIDNTSYCEKVFPILNNYFHHKNIKIVSNNVERKYYNDEFNEIHYMLESDDKTVDISNISSESKDFLCNDVSDKKFKSSHIMENTSLLDYLTKFSFIKNNLCQLRMVITTVINLKKKFEDDSIKPEKNDKELYGDLTKKFEEVAERINEIKASLDYINQQNTSYLNSVGFDSEIRIKINLEKILQKDLHEIYSELQNVQNEFYQLINDKIIQQTSTSVTPGSEANTLKTNVKGDIIDCEADVESKTMKDNKHSEKNCVMKSAASEFREKLRLIQKLRKTIKGIQNAYFEIGIVVDRNDSAIQSIDKIVMQTKQHSEVAKKELILARHSQIKYRKRLFYAIMAVFIILTVLFYPIII